MAALNKAIAERRFKQVYFFISLGANANSRYSGGETPLIQLCYVKPDSIALSLAKTLLKKEAKVGMVDKKGLSALSHAVLQQQVELVSLFLEDTGDFNLSAKDKAGNTALHYAAKTGNFDILQLMVKAVRKYRLSADAVNHAGMTPLMEATKSGHILCAQHLASTAKASQEMRDTKFWKCATEWDRRKERTQSQQTFVSSKHFQHTAIDKQISLDKRYVKSKTEPQAGRPRTVPESCRRLEKEDREDFCSQRKSLRKIYRLYQFQTSDSYRPGAKRVEAVKPSRSKTPDREVKSPLASGILVRRSSLLRTQSAHFRLQSSGSLTTVSPPGYLTSKEFSHSAPMARRSSSAAACLGRKQEVSLLGQGAEENKVASYILPPLEITVNTNVRPHQPRLVIPTLYEDEEPEES